MITVTFYKNGTTYQGFSVDGHAGFADSGHDVVCAGVSALVLTTYNSLEQLTAEDFTGEMSEDGGHFELTLTGQPVGADALLLVNSLLVGLKGIEAEYGNKFIQIRCKEV